MRIVPALVACLVLLALAPRFAPAEDAAPAKKGIAALGWLEGQWRSADGPEVWEACYSGPEGGEIVSATKMIKRGKVALFDYERIREEGDKVLLTPFPRGKASVDFTLTGFDPTARRAIFVNETHDFPSRMKYEVGDDGHLRITLAGEENGKHVGFTLDLVRKKG